MKLTFFSKFGIRNDKFISEVVFDLKCIDYIQKCHSNCEVSYVNVNLQFACPKVNTEHLMSTFVNTLTFTYNLVQVSLVLLWSFSD